MGAIAANPVLQRAIRVPPAYLVFAVLLITLWVTKPQLMNVNVMGIFIRQVAPLGILVLGQLLVMRVRSIDLSGAGVLLVVNYMISSGIMGDVPAIAYIAMALSVGLAVGLVNGYLVGRRRVSAVIATLAVTVILTGIIQFLASGKPPGDMPGYFNDIYNTKIWIVPTPVAFWLLLTVLMSLFLSRFVFGRFIAAIGENPTASHFSGVPVERTVIASHILASVIASVAALVQSASVAVGSIRLGLEMPIDAVAATILGGVIFGRGDGGVWGPFFGVMCFALLFVVMTSFGVPDPGKQIARGLIILLAAIFYGLSSSEK
ncbi:ABC transporter permease [Hoeflea poritis]|uniref:ABC transporter permease n=1 Tax=Hoeflea poritis TaxID=2993659 RepID=A0ABT4VV39_9HYPH|nr:ABC transporter permease [Hoeflea poritis]MDA4848564.1 ABC transporter permease [Hoeflea poritis]